MNMGYSYRIGHVFDGQPQVAPSHPGHYTAPPRGSKVTKGARPNSNLTAVSPDGFEWELLVDLPVWTPTGKLYRPPIIAGIGNDCILSIEGERDATMS